MASPGIETFWDTKNVSILALLLSLLWFNKTCLSTSFRLAPFISPIHPSLMELLLDSPLFLGYVLLFFFAITLNPSILNFFISCFLCPYSQLLDHWRIPHGLKIGTIPNVWCHMSPGSSMTLNNSAMSSWSFFLFSPVLFLTFTPLFSSSFFTISR